MSREYKEKRYTFPLVVGSTYISTSIAPLDIALVSKLSQLYIIRLDNINQQLCLQKKQKIDNSSLSKSFWRIVFYSFFTLSLFLQLATQKSANLVQPTL